MKRNGYRRLKPREVCLYLGLEVTVVAELADVYSDPKPGIYKVRVRLGNTELEVLRNELEPIED